MDPQAQEQQQQQQQQEYLSALSTILINAAQSLTQQPQPQPPQSPPQQPQIPSQQVIDAFWDLNLGSNQPPQKPSSVLPDNVYAKLERQRLLKESTHAVSIDESYNVAVRECVAKVAAIVRECNRVKTKYTDTHFDLDDMSQCLVPLIPDPDSDESGTPSCVKRIGEIFENPQFFIGGSPRVQDTRQGAEGDCWFLSAVISLCGDGKNHLIERLCPADARDTQVGVYGFVFNRDGEWISEVVDDKLYLNCPDYDDCGNDEPRRSVWDNNLFMDDASKRHLFRETFQRGSNALFYGSCSDQNETWLPLLEKAYAKAHGDYSAISGGWPGEGIEDLTGGITSSIKCSNILNVDDFWKNELRNFNGEFLFGMVTKGWMHKDNGPHDLRQGIEDNHAYSVLRAEEYKGERLVLIKNPWGTVEWNGSWSDGSKEWTSEALTTLKYNFSDDGIFWMPYRDFLRRYDKIWRTRLFNPQWKVTQKWTTMQIPWAGDYNPTKFQFHIPKATRVIIVLSQLDTRFFKGLEGQYVVSLNFRLHASGRNVHLVRGYSSGDRSAVTELDLLEAGDYDVFVQLSAVRYTFRPRIEDVVKTNWLTRRDKLMQIGLSYDLAQAKGQLAPQDQPKEAPGQTKVIPPTPPTGSVAPVQGVTEPSTSGGNADANDQSTPTVPVLQVQDPDGIWDATLVVGLRVFCESSSAEIKVVGSQNEAAAQIAKEKIKLDIDDPEKDLAEHHTASSVVSEEVSDSD